MQVSLTNTALPIDAVLDNLASAVVVFDAELRVLYLNQTAEMLLAISARHAVGVPSDTLSTWRGAVLLDLVRAAQIGSPITTRGVVLRNERSEVTVDCTVSPVLDAERQQVTIVELQHIDHHLRISREERLVTQQALTRDVVRGMAHEIKNPLGGLRGAAQLLEGELHGNELKEYTQVIMQEADRLQQLVDRMLGPSRLLSLAATNIHHVLERVRTLVLAETGDRINIRCDYDPSIPELTADSDQLIQAVLNVVRNAARAIQNRGSVTLRTRVQRQFTIGSECPRLAARIDIIDDGRGIPTEIADTLFLPMVTSGTGGTGLGLSIAQSLINQHGGLIECTSRRGETVFSIYLPVGKESISDPTQENSHRD